jgi:hypothetical protein
MSSSVRIEPSCPAPLGGAENHPPPRNFCAIAGLKRMIWRPDALVAFIARYQMKKTVLLVLLTLFAFVGSDALLSAASAAGVDDNTTQVAKDGKKKGKKGKKKGKKGKKKGNRGANAKKQQAA